MRPQKAPSIAQFKNLFENAPFRVYAKDMQHKFIYANQATHKAHRRNVLGTTDDDYFAPDFSGKARAEELKLLSNLGEPIHSEEYEPWLDNRLTFVHYHKFPLLNSKKQIVGTWGISSEVKEFSRRGFFKTVRVEEEPMPEGYFYRIVHRNDKKKSKSWFSDGFKAIYGWGEEAPDDESRFNAIHEQDQSAVKHALTECYADRSPKYNMTFRMKNIHGEYLWIKAYGKVVLRDPKSETIHFAGYHSNITKSKYSDDAAELILNRFPGFIFAKDENGRFLYGNKSLLTDLNMESLSDLEGKTDFDIFPPEQARMFAVADRQISSRDMPELFQREEIRMREDLSPEMFFTYKFPLKLSLETGPTARFGVFGIATKVGNYLADAEHINLLWKCLMEDESDIVYVKNIKGVYIEVNQAFERVTGVSIQRIKSEQITFESVFSRIAPEYISEIKDEEDFIISNKTPKYPDGKERRVVVNGRLRIGFSRKWPILDKAGNVVNILGISRDITALKDRARLDAQLSITTRYLDSKLVTYLQALAKGGWDKVNLEAKRVTICFCDIRGFSKLAEKLQHNTVLVTDLLKEYFNLVVELTHKFNGVVDKFIGDGAMLLFGATTSGNEAEDSVNAVRMALELSEGFMEVVNQWKKKLRKIEAEEHQITLGIGIHSGPVLVGYIKGRERDQYTALGHTVNLTQRFEAKAGKRLDSKEAEELSYLHKKFSLDQPVTFTKRDLILLSNPVFEAISDTELKDKFSRNPSIIDAKNIEGVYSVFGHTPASLRHLSEEPSGTDTLFLRK